MLKTVIDKFIIDSDNGDEYGVDNDELLFINEEKKYKYKHLPDGAKYLCNIDGKEIRDVDGKRIIIKRKNDKDNRNVNREGVLVKPQRKGIKHGTLQQARFSFYDIITS